MLRGNRRTGKGRWFLFQRGAYVWLWGGLLVTVALVGLLGKGLPVQKEPAVSSQGDQKRDVTSEVPQSHLGESILVQGADEQALVGVWVPYLSLAAEAKTEAAFRENFEAIVQTAKERGINALFVHVRPFCDALYPSDLYPWSHLLTGVQGQDPGFDPLAFMVDHAHKQGMAFHAWINPLRVKTAETPSQLSSDHPYAELSEQYPYYFMEWEGAVYLNPAYAYIRSLIAEGAAEIAARYDVDGIHFDDYFYPSEEEGLDATAYESYKQNVEVPLTLAQWRTANINTMVALVYEKVKAANPSAVFGISPAGNLEADLKMNADVKAWCAYPGYLDYICPQLYYSYDQETMPFQESLDAWMALECHGGMKRYIGLALYKVETDADEGTWLDQPDMMKRQMEDVFAAGGDGVVFYGARDLTKLDPGQMP